MIERIRLIIFFIANFGYGKIPYLGIPFGIIGLLFDGKRFYKCLIGDKNLFYFLCVSLFFFISIARSFVSYEYSINYNELSFIFSLTYKLIFAPYVGYLCFRCIEYGFSEIFIVIQVFLIFIAAYDFNLFNALLLFQSTQAVSVFSDIFGIRSIGLMIYHNEGVVMLVLLYILQDIYAPRSSLRFIDFLIYASGLMSRLIFFTLPFYQFLFKIKAILLTVFLLLIVAISLDVTEGPLYQIFELFVNYSINGELHSNSASHISTMSIIPEGLTTLWLGDGRYFSEDLFYMETDIGIARLLFFGGVPYLALYFILNFIPIFGCVKEINKLNWNLKIFVSCLIILVANFKGLNPHVWFFYAVKYMISYRKISNND